MKENIDQLYNRKLKGVETRPPEEVWNNISSRLPIKRSKKRAIPLFFKLGGVAAALALIIFMRENYLSISGNPQVNVVWEDPSAEIKKEFLHFDFNNSQLTGSSLLLENLILRGKNRIVTTGTSKTNKTATGSNSGSYFQEIATRPDISTPAKEKFSFHEFNNAAFQQEMEQQEILPQKTEDETSLGEIAALDKKEELPEEENVRNPKMQNRLSITPTAAAVYSDNLGKGNFIDNSFENNNTSGEISMAYGVQLAYQVTQKLRIRTGVTKVDLGYTTKDINFGSAINSRALGGSGMMENNTANTLSLATPVSGNLNQQMGFIEVPLEFEFALSDNKLGLNIIAGGSTLFLGNNMISLNSPEMSTTLGEAQNLNTVSYSANIGVGINYSISTRFLWNLEPVFKYQINTFNNTEGVNPYYLGLYSGFSYKF